MPTQMLDLDAVTDFFYTHITRSAFRLELLDTYDVETDGADVARYLAGEPDPNAEAKQPWLDKLAADIAAGTVWSRVHVVRSPLNDYLRYEFEWGYAYNAAAGEQIRILDLAERAAPAGLIDEEFWILDDQHLLLMHYDQAGRFAGGTTPDPANLPQYRAARDAAWAAAEPFEFYWARHPEYHRDNRRAA